jgi:hypothetical protein
MDVRDGGTARPRTGDTTTYNNLSPSKIPSCALQIPRDLPQLLNVVSCAAFMGASTYDFNKNPHHCFKIDALIPCRDSYPTLPNETESFNVLLIVVDVWIIAESTR